MGENSTKVEKPDFRLGAFCKVELLFEVVDFQATFVGFFAEFLSAALLGFEFGFPVLHVGNRHLVAEFGFSNSEINDRFRGGRGGKGVENFR